MENKVKESVEILTEALRNDPDYYYSWQANIAMAFKDEYENSFICRGDDHKEILHTVANNAAKNFLNILIRK